jgi:hypothetical protein
MKKVFYTLMVIVVLLAGFLTGEYYGGSFKMNPIIKESLERRTVTLLQKQQHEPGQYIIKTLKSHKFNGMQDYNVDIQFKTNQY